MQSPPLLRAADQGSCEIVACLLEAGANPNCENVNHHTPLGGAAQRRDRRMARLLLEKGSEGEPNLSSLLSFKAQCRI
eukprot:m.249694 g.249694  ORF g.249694 m.249694 type:complete len:78 (+) comp26687_c4_seq17:401-634(+)